MRFALVLSGIFLPLACGFCPASEGDGLSDILTADIDPNELEHDGIFNEAYDSDGNRQFVEADEDPNAFGGNKILQEFGTAVTSTKMDRIYSLDEKKTSALLMLEYVLKETSLDPEYMTNAFIQKAAVDTKEALAEKTYNEKQSLEFLSSILHHMQSNPLEVESDDELSAEKEESSESEEQKSKDEL